jgi:hypothetical protein
MSIFAAATKQSTLNAGLDNNTTKPGDTPTLANIDNWGITVLYNHAASHLGPYSQNPIFFLTYDWNQ